MLRLIAVALIIYDVIRSLCLMQSETLFKDWLHEHTAKHLLKRDDQRPNTQGVGYLYVDSHFDERREESNNWICYFQDCTGEGFIHYDKKLRYVDKILTAESTADK